MTDLALLRCSKCDAPLVLADGDTVTCASCGTANPVPAAYRELHGARLADKQLHDESVRLLRDLDQPPLMATKVLARIFDLPMFAFWLAYGIPLGLFAILHGLALSDRLARHRGIKPDDMPIAYTVVFAAAIILVFAFVPRVLGIYANRRVTDRARLLAALRAKPPTVAGGPSTCRLCGAPLAVADDELVATCSYCRAENAVKIETPIVEAATAQVVTLGKTMREVADSDRAQRRATRVKLVTELLHYIVRIGLIAGLAIVGMQENEDHTPTTGAAIALVATVLLMIAFMAGFLRNRNDDARDRAAGNDAPAWLSVAGPIGVLFLLYVLRGHI